MSAIDDRYAELGGEAGPLGPPVGEEQAADFTWHYRLFEHGAIYWLLRTAPPIVWEVHDPIWPLYQSLGMHQSILGFPESNQNVCPDGVGKFNHFQNGAIYWNPETGAHEIHGLIWKKWASLGRERSILGYPITDEFPCPDGVGAFSHFQNGAIYWTPQTDAHEIHGVIWMKWASLGWERSVLGYPTSDENPCPDGVGAFSHFQNGAIYWTPQTDAHEIHGEIWKKWASLGWERSFLGYPVTDQTQAYDGVAVVGPSGAAVRLVSYFQHGSIYWDPNLGVLPPVPTPTWEFIKTFFTEEDLNHMLYGSEEGYPNPPMDLANYDTVRQNAQLIYERVSIKDWYDKHRMPPPPRDLWPAELVEAFLCWRLGGMPQA